MKYMSEITRGNEVQLKTRKVPELLRGYEKANEFMTAERIAFLKSLTPQESLKILCSLWQTGKQLNGPIGDQDALERRKVTELIHCRSAFDRLARRGND
jgi:hypothetical protein